MAGGIRPQLLKGTTPLLILSVLKDGELYGYEIAQRIRERSGKVFAPNEGSLYPALHALAADGALEQPGGRVIAVPVGATTESRRRACSCSNRMRPNGQHSRWA